MDQLRIIEGRDSRSRSHTPFLRSSCDREMCTAEDHNHEVKRHIKKSTPTKQFSAVEESYTKTSTFVSKSEQKNLLSSSKTSDYSSEETEQKNEQCPIVTTSIYNTRSRNMEATKIANTQNKTNERFISKSASKLTPMNGAVGDHPAYKLYKEAGDYWNKYPKTDYTYSEHSVHRREIAPGVVAMPNMSRRSLHSLRDDETDSTFSPFQLRKNRFNEVPKRRLEQFFHTEQNEINYRRYLQTETFWQKILRVTRITLVYTTIITYFSKVWSSFVHRNENFYKEEIEFEVQDERRWYLRIWDLIKSTIIKVHIGFYILLCHILLMDSWLLKDRFSKIRGISAKTLFWLLFIPFLILLAWWSAPLLTEKASAFYALLENLTSTVSQISPAILLLPFYSRETSQYVPHETNIIGTNVKEKSVFAETVVSKNVYENTLSPEIIDNIVNTVQNNLINNNYIENKLSSPEVIARVLYELKKENLLKDSTVHPEFISKITNIVHGNIDKIQSNYFIGMNEKYDSLNSLQNENRIKIDGLRSDLDKCLQSQDELKLMIANIMKTCCDTNGDRVIGALTGVTTQDVEEIVRNILAVYDADKTGLADYALESAGAEIKSIRCTESYNIKTAQWSIYGIPLWYSSNNPRVVISPGIVPGECWSFQGYPGFLVIKLSQKIHITAFSLEHIPVKIAPSGNIDSAPQNFSVWGLQSEIDREPLKLGQYVYRADGTPLQYFIVQHPDPPPYEIVELKIESNHGNLHYTCLYRFRVHGRVIESPPP